MIPYLPCDRAWDLLEPFVDDELPMSEQVVLEAHLRWCDTCQARVEDMRLIAGAVRAGSVVRPLDPQVTAALTAMRRDVLARVDAEHTQSLAVRGRELVTDVRYVWPALGATLALILCVYAATSVSRIARAVSPNSMAALIAVLASPGSDQNPLYLDADMLAPRGLFVGEALARIPEEEAAFAVAAVVTRQGRVSNYEVLSSSDLSEHAAVRDMVSQSRFKPAQTPDGAVAVNVVWLLTRTTVKGSAKAEDAEIAPTGALERPALHPASS
jgi:anti-sigma factor RsiW